MSERKSSSNAPDGNATGMWTIAINDALIDASIHTYISKQWRIEFN